MSTWRGLLKVCLSERDVALIKSLLINAKCEISKDVASQCRGVSVCVWVPQGGCQAVTGGGWYYDRPPAVPIFLSLSPLPSLSLSLVVLLSHNYNSIVIQFLGRQINRISFLVTRHAPRPVAAHSPSWGEVRHGGCGRVGCTCSSSDWCLCQLFWCQINKLLTVGRQAGGGGSRDGGADLLLRPEMQISLSERRGGRGRGTLYRAPLQGKQLYK